MTLTVQHVPLGNVDDVDGVLVYDGNVLVAVLCQLSFEHGERAGRWFLECGFGARLDAGADFPNLQSACDWIEGRIERAGQVDGDALARPPAKT
jgi:hypothetical protein